MTMKKEVTGRGLLGLTHTCHSAILTPSYQKETYLLCRPKRNRIPTSGFRVSDSQSCLLFCLSLLIFNLISAPSGFPFSFAFHCHSTIYTTFSIVTRETKEKGDLFWVFFLLLWVSCQFRDKQTTMSSSSYPSGGIRCASSYPIGGIRCVENGGGELHVLAVDDSSVDRKLIEKLLKGSSSRVTTVDSGKRALELLEVGMNGKSTLKEPKVNMIITDYCMPEMTGYDLLKRVKESSVLKEIPVVVVSSENVPNRINRCLEEGAEEFLLKPLRQSDVSRLCSRMVQQGR